MDLVEESKKRAEEKLLEHKNKIENFTEINHEKLEKLRKDEDINDTFDFISEIESDESNSKLELSRTYKIDELYFKLRFVIILSNLQPNSYQDVKIYINDNFHSSMNGFNYETIGYKLSLLMDIIRIERESTKVKIKEALELNIYNTSFNKLKKDYLTENEFNEMKIHVNKLRQERDAKELLEKENRDKVDKLIDTYNKYSQHFSQRFELWRQELTQKYWSSFFVTTVQYAPSAIVYIENVQDEELDFLQSDVTIGGSNLGWYNKLDKHNNRLTKKHYFNLVSEEIFEVTTADQKYCLKLDISKCIHESVKSITKFIYVNPHRLSDIVIKEEDYWTEVFKSLDEYMTEQGYERTNYGNWIKASTSR